MLNNIEILGKIIEESDDACIKRVHQERKGWTAEQKKIVLEAFKDYLSKTVCPSLESIRSLQKDHVSLQNKSAPVIKTWFNNQQKRKRKDVQ